MINFLESNKSIMEQGFWTELYPDTLKHAVESQYNTEVIREWYIVEITNSEKMVLVKWKKRYQPLNDVRLKEMYGR